MVLSNALVEESPHKTRTTRMCICAAERQRQVDGKALTSPIQSERALAAAVERQRALAAGVERQCALAAGVERVVVCIHEGQRLVTVGALLGVALVHGVDHHSHLLAGAVQRLLTLFGQFP